ncbi:conserved hypothetical protein [Paecilomyces variotii No. 5]|uniref:Uncharacterized protein n=1 Tax=Byssochlamys spectabilis (strain No. 5 / NBRC 109023) TaxID=1356009 RepID=V5GD66_BYSSN|nr:conserved hypothetical protein [Paecilomyces variotii No. 5]
MASNQKFKRLVLTAAVTSITIAGSLYGAGLKAEQEAKQAEKQRNETPIDDRIESLRTLRNELVTKRNVVEKQMQDLESRIEDRKRKGLGVAPGQRPDEG